jgi:hypothetical protein
LECVGWEEHGSQFAASFEGLGFAFKGEFDAVIGYSLVDVAVLIAFALGVADEDD